MPEKQIFSILKENNLAQNFTRDKLSVKCENRINATFRLERSQKTASLAQESTDMLPLPLAPWRKYKEELMGFSTQGLQLRRKPERVHRMGKEGECVMTAVPQA